MNSILFDTFAYAKKLKEAGFTETQAEVQADALAEIIEGRMATRRDLRDTGQLLRRDLKKTEHRIIAKMVLTLCFGIGITVLLIRLFSVN